MVFPPDISRLSYFPAQLLDDCFFQPFTERFPVKNGGNPRLLQYFGINSDRHVRSAFILLHNAI